LRPALGVVLEPEPQVLEQIVEGPSHVTVFDSGLDFVEGCLGLWELRNGGLERVR
jgi:hypothetical protein